MKNKTSIILIIILAIIIVILAILALLPSPQKKISEENQPEQTGSTTVITQSSISSSTPTSTPSASTTEIKIYSISPTTGPIGTRIMLTGNFSENEYGGPEYATEIIVENQNGEKAVVGIMPKNNTASFTIQANMCEKDTSASGMPCPSPVAISPGAYQIYYYNAYLVKKSNSVTFIVTQ